MKLFLDTSVLLAACGSAMGASREIFQRALSNEWVLVTTPYVVAEVLTNLPKLPPSAAVIWPQLQGQLSVAEDIFTVDRPVVFEKRKDRPILLSALAWSDVLLTLDREDFGGLMSEPFYGLKIMTPGMFLSGKIV